MYVFTSNTFLSPKWIVKFILPVLCVFHSLLGELSEDLTIGDMCDPLATDPDQQAAMEQMYTALSDGEIQVGQLAKQRYQTKTTEPIFIVALLSWKKINTL